MPLTSPHQRLEEEARFDVTAEAPSEWHSLGDVAIGGDLVVVGSPTMGEGPGTALVYRRERGTWTKVAALSLPSTAGSYDDFGWAVVVESGLIVVGAPEVGAITAFVEEDGGWALALSLTREGGEGVSRFGEALALEGSVLVEGDFVQSGYTGSASAYDLARVR